MAETITASMVKELREQTGAGMMDCKAALNESSGNIDAAVDWLRKKGPVEGREEGRPRRRRGPDRRRHVRHQRRRRRGQFGDRFRRPQRAVPGPGQDDRRCRAHDRLRRREDPRGQGRQHHRCRRDLRQCRQDRREHDLAPRRRAVGRPRAWSATYVHSSVTDGLGRIGVIVGLESAGKADELKAFGRLVAMHVAAANPQAVDPSGLDPAAVEREKNVLADKFKAQGKPANVIEKIVEVGPEDLLQGSLPARSAVHPRRQEVRRAGGERGRRQSRRTDQGHGLCALCARRRRRETGRRFQRRSRRSSPARIRPGAAKSRRKSLPWTNRTIGG